MIDWMIYTKIHELKNNGLRKTQVARRLNINRETVSTYWDMSPGENAAKEAASKKRKKKRYRRKYSPSKRNILHQYLITVSVLLQKV